MNLVIDVDGVIRDFVASVFRMFNARFPDLAHKVGEQTAYPLASSYGQLFPLIHKFIFQDHAEDVFGKAMPYVGAIRAVNILSEKHNVLLATSQVRGQEKYTLDWLQRWGVKYEAILFNRHKWLLRGDLYLDDCTENLEDIKGRGNVAVCMDRPWNQDWTGLRVHTITEFAGIVGRFEMAKGKP